MPLSRSAPLWRACGTRYSAPGWQPDQLTTKGYKHIQASLPWATNIHQPPPAVIMSTAHEGTTIGIDCTGGEKSAD